MCAYVKSFQADLFKSKVFTPLKKRYDTAPLFLGLGSQSHEYNGLTTATAALTSSGLRLAVIAASTNFCAIENGFLHHRSITLSHHARLYATTPESALH